MDLLILKKKIDGYRSANGTIKNISPELLLELRQTWENYIGTSEQFRSELGIKIGTMRNLLKESKKLNHVIASAAAVELAVESGSEGNGSEQGHSQESHSLANTLELVFDHGSKVIRFPTVDLLIDFMRKTA